MEKCIILIAGLLAAGKTTFSEYLSEKLQILCVNKDYVKELLCDTVGFTNRAENKRLSVATYHVLKHIAENSMKIGKPIILESNFTTQEGENIALLIQKYGYKPLTIMLDGDLKVLQKRFIDRLNNTDRHAAHRAVDSNIDMTVFEDFKKISEALRNFNVGGKKIVVDTTDFAKVSYDDIIREIVDYYGNN